jgi:polyvinyl alcohol dehydrogenase (cytochrome)
VRRRWLIPVVSMLLVGAFAPSFAGASGSADWPAYLFSAGHTSLNASTAITPTNVGSLTEAWVFNSPAPTMIGQPGGGFTASPTVYGGRVYIGSNTGVFYALDEATGSIVWSRFLGFVPRLTCGARGISATATVALDPVTQSPTVYVSGGDGNLYALNASTGAEVWHSKIVLPSSTVNDFYDWSSPTVANGKVYIGVSSQCDAPLIRGRVKSYDQHTGARIATWYSMPAGSIGGSVWSSVAADSTSVWATTGNAENVDSGDWNSIVRLDPTTLTRMAGWKVPSAQAVMDSDFGGSPTLFTVGGVSMIGACNKDGYYYAWRSSDLAKQWQLKVASGSPLGAKSCLAAAVWDGSRLFVAGPFTTIGGTAYHGSIRSLDPSTGRPVWQTGLPGTVIGSPSLNAGGVLAVPLYDRNGGANGAELISASTGARLRLISANNVFAQPTFAGNYLFIAGGGRLIAWKVP